MRASSVANLESIEIYLPLPAHIIKFICTGRPQNPHGLVISIAAKALFPACFGGSSARIIDFCINFLPSACLAAANLEFNFSIRVTLYPGQIENFRLRNADRYKI
jgi:hypothetical protein